MDPVGAISHHLSMDTLFLLPGDIFQDTPKNIKPHSDCRNQTFLWPLLSSYTCLIISSKPDALIASFVDLKKISLIYYSYCPEITTIWVIFLLLFPVIKFTYIYLNMIFMLVFPLLNIMHCVFFFSYWIDEFQCLLSPLYGCTSMLLDIPIDFSKCSVSLNNLVNHWRKIRLYLVIFVFIIYLFLHFQFIHGISHTIYAK